MQPAPSLPALFLQTIKKLPPQPASFGRAASGGALALELPEFIRNLSKNIPFFSFFCSAKGLGVTKLEKKGWVQPAKLKKKSSQKLGQNSVCEKNLGSVG